MQENRKEYKAGQYLKLSKTISDFLDKRVNAVLKDCNLTNSQVLLMDVLGKKPEMQCTFKELEADLNLSQPTVAGLVRRLETKGYITSCPSPEDRRVKLARMTPEGGRAFDAAADAVADEIGPMLHMIMNEDELAEYMRKMNCVNRWIREQNS